MSPQSAKNHKSVCGAQFSQPKVKETTETSRQNGELQCADLFGFVSVKTSFLKKLPDKVLQMVKNYKQAYNLQQKNALKSQCKQNYFLSIHLQTICDAES